MRRAVRREKPDTAERRTGESVQPDASTPAADSQSGRASSTIAGGAPTGPQEPTPTDYRCPSYSYVWTVDFHVTRDARNHKSYASCTQCGHAVEIDHARSMPWFPNGYSREEIHELLNHPCPNPVITTYPWLDQEGK